MRGARTGIAVGLIALAALVVAAASPRADGAAPRRPGTLDRSFGHGGKAIATAPRGGANSEFGAMVREADGGLLLELLREAKEKEGTVREIERRLPDGSLDPSFGKDGRVVVGAGAGLALQADGDIVVGVSRCEGKPSSAILLDPQGRKVPHFGTKGCGPQLPFPPNLISVAADGRIFLAGPDRHCPPCGHDSTPEFEAAVARLRPDGSRDASFGGDGVVRTRADLGVEVSENLGETLYPSGIAATADGGVAVATGSLLLRLGAGGALVPGFGKGGVAEVEGSTAGLVSLPDGRIVVVASRNQNPYPYSGEVTVSRFQPDGTLDPGFGGGGTTVVAPSPASSAWAVAAAPEGGVLVAGELHPAEGCRELSCAWTPFLARLESDGRLDPAYGDGGIADLPQPPDLESGGSLGLSALVVDSDGTALVAGGRYGENAFAIARAPDGTPEAGFGEGGLLVERYYLPPDLEVSGFALDPKGGFTVAAEGTAGRHEFGGFLLGFGRDGRQHPGPLGTGVAPTLARGEIQPSGGGRVVSWWEASRSVLAVGRDGTAASGYGNQGTVKLPRGFRPTAIERAPRGGVAVVGAVDGLRAMAIYRLGPDGRPVTGFGHQGMAEVPFGRKHALAFAALVEADGSVFLTGWAGDRVGVARLLPSGRLDRRFGRGGRVRGPRGTGTYGTQIAPFHGGVVIAATGERGPPSLAGLIRLDRRGRLVRGFGRGGAVHVQADGRALALLSGAGRIVVVADTRNDRRGRGGVELRAYRPDGSLDRGFGHGGLVRGGVGQAEYFQPEAAVQQRDGKIVVAGSAFDGEYGKVELLRFR